MAAPASREARCGRDVYPGNGRSAVHPTPAAAKLSSFASSARPRRAAARLAASSRPSGVTFPGYDAEASASSTRTPDFFSHQSSPTTRFRRSSTNAGFLPSNRCPRN